MTVGRAKLLLERWRNNIGILNTVLLVYLTVTTKPISIWWFVGGFALSVVYLWYDMKYIYPKESAAYNLKNPEWIKLTDAIERIENAINSKKTA